jgi:hypothetical protein
MLDPSGPFITRQCFSAGGFCAIHLASSILQDYSSKPDLSIRKSHHNIVEFIKPVSLQCRLNLALGSELQDVDEVRRVIVRRADDGGLFEQHRNWIDFNWLSAYGGRNKSAPRA